jgi:hypothetical protein
MREGGKLEGNLNEKTEIKFMWGKKVTGVTVV